MTVEFKDIVFILILHFLADFALQTPDQSKYKSTSNDHLLRHVLNYSVTWFVASYILFEHWGACVFFALITFIIHYITDYFSSRIGKPFWENGDYHNGFVVVGADQTFHYLQLILTFLWTTHMIES